MDPEKFLQELQRRGVRVNSALTESAVRSYEKQIGEKLDSYFEQVYKTFDGYASHDDTNHVTLWKFERIVENRGISVERGGVRFFAFADILMDSDLVMGGLGDAHSSVFLLYEGRELAANVPDFFSKLVKGEYDLKS